LDHIKTIIAARVSHRRAALLNLIGEITVDEVDEETGITYFCPGQHLHSHHNDDAG
jgi:hypothetical protein